MNNALAAMMIGCDLAEVVKYLGGNFFSSVDILELHWDLRVRLLNLPSAICFFRLSNAGIAGSQ